MVQWAINDFGGEIPRSSPRVLPPNMAEAAWNTDLTSGTLEGLPIPELLIDLSASPGTVLRAYRFPGPNAGDPDVWLPLPSPYSSVMRSPLANDTTHRLYWTNPGEGAFWSTYDMIQAGTAPYNLGIIQPDPATSSLTVTASGGTVNESVPEVVRSYLWTYVNAYGEESAPNFPSADVTGASDGNWEIQGLPQSAPANPPGLNYPPVVGVNLYRTITGTTTGASFYQVENFLFASNPPPADYDDTTQDDVLTENLTLMSQSWSNPLPTLDGLLTLPGGMLVGFTDNTVHFSEVDRPHTWPAAYDQSVQYKIVGLGLWQQSLVVLTEGYPSTGTGTSPASFVFTQINVPEPCIARGSIITDLLGCYYASQNGLVMLNYFGMTVQTQQQVVKNVWLNEFNAASILACRHRSQYLAITPAAGNSGVGFLIDYSEPRLGIVQLNTFDAADCVWNDPYTGDAYIISAKKVYRWDSPNTGPLNYRWRSRQFYNPKPISLGACQISLDPAVTDPAPISNPVPLGNGDPTLVLPAGVNAICNIYAGPDGEHLVMTQQLTEPRVIFRLPSGFKAFDWQIEIVSRVGVRSIELATTMSELGRV